MRRVAWFLIPLLLSTVLLGCRDKDDGSVLGYIEGRYVYLSSSQSGILFSRYVHRGAQVRQGQLLFRLDPNPELDQVQQDKAELVNAKQNLINLIKGSRQTVLDAIQAQIRQAKADAALALVTYQRKKRLYQQAAVSKQVYDDALTKLRADDQKVLQLEANLAEAKLGARDHLIKAQSATVAADQAALSRAQWALAQKTVHAPKAGFVFDTFYNPGEFVPAGQAVLALLDPRNIRVIFFVPEQKLSAVKMGQMVSFTCDGCHGKPQARVYYISPSAEYTPVVLFSESARQKLVYRVEAYLPKATAANYHPGQPINVYLNNFSNQPGPSHG